MTKLNRLAYFALAGCLTAGASAASFTFDTDSQGWTKGDFGNGFANIDPDTAGPADWNAGGFITAIDHATYAFVFSSNLGGGFGSAFGTELTFDFASRDPQPDIPFVTLVSSTDFIVLEQPLTANAVRQPYSLTLNSSEGWAYNSSDYHGTATAATDAQIQAVLNDLQFIGVSSDQSVGSDFIELDNVVLVPEPATLAALGLGAAALLRRRRK